MSFVKNLEVRLLLEKNDSVLYTQRNQAQSWILFLSSLGGSIIGLLGTIGVIMNLFEGQYKSFIERYRNRLNFKDLLRRRIQLKKGTFSIHEIVDSNTQCPSFHLDTDTQSVIGVLVSRILNTSSQSTHPYPRVIK